LSVVPVYQLDANVILRFLMDDNKDFAPRARDLIRRANEGQVVLEISAVTVAEIIYAMKASYQIHRRQASAVVADLLRTPAFHMVERRRILDSLARVVSANVDFGDAYLAATAAETGTAVASFDRDLDRFADVKRMEP